MKNIEENNRLICDFMGAKLIDKKNGEPKMYNTLPISHKIGGLYHSVHPSCLEFHNDWNWLTPVIEKIETLIENVSTHSSKTISGKWYQYTIEFYKYDILKKIYIVQVKSDYSNNESKISTYYRAVIEFINWYNEQSR